MPQATQSADAEFRANVNRYLQTTDAARHPAKLSTSVKKIHDHRQQIAEGIRSARASAHQGEIFTPTVAEWFRGRLKTTLDGPDGPKIRASLRHAEPVRQVDLKVDSQYPASVPLQSMPPSLLLNLPQLPKGLEYRIVGRVLVLRDADADTIADFLPLALPAPRDTR
jgi:hypothetical protein